MDIEHLSYPVRKKTEKIVKIKNQLDSSRKSLMLPSALTGICTSYVVLFCQRYFDYTLAAFNPWSSISSRFILLDISMLILLAFSGFVMYISFSKHNKLKASYETLRKDLIRSINTEFCKCSEPQSCKDEYIEIMEENGIDLIF